MSSVNENLINFLEQTNPPDVFLAGVEILLRLLDNIIKEPSNQKFRTIRLGNKTVKEKLLITVGMKNILLDIGFEENDEELILSPNVLIAKVKNYREAILKRLNGFQKAAIIPSTSNLNRPIVVANAEEKEKQRIIQLEAALPSTSKSIIHKITSDQLARSLAAAVPNCRVKRKSEEDLIYKEILPLYPSVLTTSNPYLRSLEFHSDLMMQYENERLQIVGRELIPLETLKISALEKLRDIQEAIRSGNFNEPEPSIEDLLIVELCNWFNTKFFEWIDKIACKICQQHNRGHAFVTIEHGVKVEAIQCCNQLTKFFRFNDVKLLLKTRRGRCGEYANCFTFLCRCLGYDARYVSATFDHVWTEVYSIAQKRWIHVDPSDNIIDAPLMYQHGWKRRIDYVTAFSMDDVQDVTWRYTSDHKNTRAFRQKCSEEEFLQIILKLRKKRQTGLSEARLKYLNQRTLQDLVQMMVQRPPTENENKGRSSGSLAWRAQRGEQSSLNSFVFEAAQANKLLKQFHLRYSCVEDKYEIYLKKSDNSIELLQMHKGWENCCYSQRNISRKEERDWKMVYLARQEETDNAEIVWKFDFTKENLRVKSYSLKFDTKTYENGNIQVEINDLNDKGLLTINDLSSFVIRATLTGGKGDIAWQHTQLFRQSLNSTDEFPFELNILF